MARIEVTDGEGRIEYSLRSEDGAFSVRVEASEADALPPESCFASLAESSAFFEAGDRGYTPSPDGSRLDGLQLRTHGWRARPLKVASLHSSYCEDPGNFPKGSIEYDHALVMRDIEHEWSTVHAPEAASTVSQ
ncbi:hypothetical protein OP10G_2823 [Fimbriimonas ginsengisoli Gsoil 348]|uniref:Uncharacterized protein n=2 Tax=Fimbriimonas ginsengisoli TaxID=1005039 RepID=A0A068NRX6_FIMGI|nr:hypothetical protein OP10G_2823 [Fimbriimonas ginsengisoli Gsoil 348]